MEHDSFARFPDFTSVLVESAENPPPLRGRVGRGGAQDDAPPLDITAPHPQTPSRKGAGAASRARLRFTAHDGAHLIGEPA